MNTELFESLSEREKDVLRLLAAGHEAKSVAQVLGLSVHTVNEYLRAARRKLDAPNSRSAAREFAAYEGEQSKKLGTPDFLGDEKTGKLRATSTGMARPQQAVALCGSRSGLEDLSPCSVFWLLYSRFRRV
ncbi:MULTISPECIES: response regulator transcription factor [unclassified Brevundimonas]|uniref:response regulator transcription factor n=1 Tax=unclassified Brevundimonas TaxID=2622653 RepID=UPI0025C38DAC|nr:MULTISPECIES: helix-turn-helix transcriptional regulator [unclassified Brevundimonas]